LAICLRLSPLRSGSHRSIPASSLAPAPGHVLANVVTTPRLAIVPSSRRRRSGWPRAAYCHTMSRPYRSVGRLLIFTGCVFLIGSAHQFQQTRNFLKAALSGKATYVGTWVDRYSWIGRSSSLFAIPDYSDGVELPLYSKDRLFSRSYREGEQVDVLFLPDQFIARENRFRSLWLETVVLAVFGISLCGGGYSLLRPITASANRPAPDSC
jgi:hypothetical protein